MTEEEVTPLFKPGESLIEKAKFICNINGELSLWDVGTALRVYGEDSYGIWLESEEHVRNHVAKAGTYTNSVTTPAIARNFEVILVYMRMLGVKP